MGILEVSRLNKSFSTPSKEVIHILDDCSLDLPKGESLAILGSSGSGKSTLLSLIAGLDRPDEGSIFIDEKELTKMNGKELSYFRSQKIGIVFQHFYLVSHLNALENVMLPMQLSGKARCQEEAMDLLKSVKLERRAKHYPRELSGGEMQRVAIARALSLKPALLIADEPTGNLDVETAKTVTELFFHLVEENKMSAVIVTHSKDLASNCKRTLVLKNGRLNP